MKWVLHVVAGGLILLIAVLLIRTLGFTSKQLQVGEGVQVPVSQDRIVAHLSEGFSSRRFRLKMKSNSDLKNFVACIAFLSKRFRVFTQC